MALVRIRVAALVAVLGALLLVMQTPLEAQTTSASVFGQVTDAQGGALPGATATLTSRTQGGTQTAVTDAEGRFVFPIVRPDSYAIKVTMQGFKTLERTNLQVNSNDKASAGIFALPVGAVTEEISVLARVTELQAASGERSFTLESKAIENIANNGRALFGLITLVPGIVPMSGAANGGSLVEAGDGFSTNGQRQNSNNITVDGVGNMDTGNNGGSMATTNTDAIAEFKVLTNAYQAEYGRAIGAQVQAVTKSGTQEFHGSGYWYGRRSDWAANSWTNNRAGAPAPVGSGKVTPKAESKRDDYGYTLGGPLYIPGKFNADKKKLFFFFSQEFEKRKDPVGETRVTVPTALERRGDFSQSRDNSGNPFPYVHDYQTGLPCETTAAGNHAGCFQDGGVLGRIPQNRLYQPSLAGLSIYPEPNRAGQVGFNYASQTPNDTPRREDLLRLDFHPSDNWRFTGRYMQSKDDRSLPYGTTWAGAGGNVDTVQTVQSIPGRNWMVSTTGVLNSTTSLEISVGSAHNSIDFSITNPDLRRAAAGMSGYPLLFPDAVQEDYLPDFSYTGSGARIANPVRIQTDRGPFTNSNTTYDAIANLTKVWRAHTFKTGLYYQHSAKPQSPFISFNSQTNFGNTGNNPFDTGFAFANAAIGVYDSYTQANKYALPNWVYSNVEAFIQDNWKATSRLTLDYGVRFYYLTPDWDNTLAASTFLPDKFDPSKAVELYRPVCIGTYPCVGTDRRVGMDPSLIGKEAPTTANTVAGAFIGRIVPNSGDRFNGSFQAGQGVSKTLSNGNAFRISPRFGFVYDLSGKQSTIVRGGFGIFYDRPQGNMVFDQIGNAPGIQTQSLSGGGLLSSVGSGTGPQLAAPLGMTPTDFNFAPPKVYAWNVGVQKKLPAAMTFDLAYVGSKSVDLLQQKQINAVPYGAKFKPENQDPTLNPSTTPGATALPDNFLRPYQGYAGIRLWGYGAFSNYHSLQTSLNRRFDRGLLLGVSYVWSKALGTVNDDYTATRPNSNDADIRRADYSYLSYDRPHNFVINFVYQTPRVGGGVLGVLANNWQISGIYRWTSGTPYSIGFNNLAAANITGSDSGQNGRIVLVGDPGKGQSGDPYRQINTAAFAPPQPGSEGFESARFFLHGPPINNLDLSLSKSFPLGKNRKIEIRLDAFNALNKAQFSGVNSTINFTSLTNPAVTNLPYNANGDLVNPNGFGTVNGVRLPRQIQLVTRLQF